MCFMQISHRKQLTCLVFKMVCEGNHVVMVEIIPTLIVNITMNIGCKISPDKTVLFQM